MDIFIVVIGEIIRIVVVYFVIRYFVKDAFETGLIDFLHKHYNLLPGDRPYQCDCNNCREDV